jgi:hypothetical protein
MNKIERFLHREDPPNPAQIALCRRWMEMHCEPSGRRINYEESAYGLKHVVERWCKTFGPHVHISETSLIAAARELGYRKTMTVTGHTFFNMVPKLRP